jgi:hypothetical protein
MSYDSREDTLKHIERVRKYLDVLIMAVVMRKEGHDASKLESPEKETFDRVTPLLAGLTYGSDEYKAMLAEMQVALDHHYAHNRHHPEHFKGTEVRQGGKVVERWNEGMRGMTLADLVEMFCDWCAATERHDDGNIGKSIDHNMTRFGFGETLASIMCNTAREYSMGRRSHHAYRPNNAKHEGQA